MTATSKRREELRRLRELAGLSQRALAARIGVNEMTVLRWETGRTARIQHAKLVPLATALGVSLAELLHALGVPA